MESKQIELCVPAERSALLIIRMTTVGVMSRVGLTLDEMDDMKMAIDEACNLMMLQKSACQKLAVAYEYNEKEVSIRIEGHGIDGESEARSDTNMQEVICCILESIVDEVNLVPAPNGETQAVCLKKYIPERRRTAV